MIAEKDTFKKIHEKLADYGFILRYLEGREDSTGYTYEPWHLRYVGNKDIAKEIMDKNMTFEEYLESQKDLVNNHEAAKLKIEQTLQKELKKMYNDKISNSRFNVKNIYTSKYDGDDETIKGLKLGDKDLAFDVEFEMLPTEDGDISELTIPDGEMNETTGWITDKHRVGILKYNDKTKTYKLENFGTGW